VGYNFFLLVPLANPVLYPTLKSAAPPTQGHGEWTVVEGGGGPQQGSGDARWLEGQNFPKPGAEMPA